jgi:hypothetical protein
MNIIELGMVFAAELMVGGKKEVSDSFRTYLKAASCQKQSNLAKI